VELGEYLKTKMWKLSKEERGKILLNVKKELKMKEEHIEPYS